MKYAVYVEGQSEMLFVADILEKYSVYNADLCGFSCINLNSDQHSYLSQPKQGDRNSKFYYQIVNANNDTLVNSKIKTSYKDLSNKGFDLIIGLRDVFGDSYRRLAKNKHFVDFNFIKRMHEVQFKEIENPDIKVKLNFAVMEFEAWLLALLPAYAIHNNMDLNKIYLDCKLDPTVPVESVYHPTSILTKLLENGDKAYDKHGKDTRSFLSSISKDDYENLRLSGRVPSFSLFVDTLLDKELLTQP